MKPRRLFCPILAALLLATTVRAGETTPAAEKLAPPALDLIDTSITLIASSKIHVPGGGTIQQCELDADFQFTRRVLIQGNWYMAFGLSYEGFYFTRHAPGLPRQLQAYAGVIAAQYIVQNEVAATVELRPGFYFGNELTRQAFDIPITCYVPAQLGAHLFALAGFHTSGFQNPPIIPIGGLIWLIRDELRLEALFPQSRLVYSPGKQWEYQVKAEIAGDSFRMDRDRELPGRLRGAAVEFAQYRCSLGANYSFGESSSVALELGYVIERSIDYFRAGDDQRSGGSVYGRLQGSLQF